MYVPVLAAEVSSKYFLLKDAQLFLSVLIKQHAPHVRVLMVSNSTGKLKISF